jgi:hypothetical protein
VKQRNDGSEHGSDESAQIMKRTHVNSVNRRADPQMTQLFARSRLRVEPTKRDASLSGGGRTPQMLRERHDVEPRPILRAPIQGAASAVVRTQPQVPCWVELGSAALGKRVDGAACQGTAGSGPKLVRKSRVFPS